MPKIARIDATLGAVVTDLDLARLDALTWKTVEQAFHEMSERFEFMWWAEQGSNLRPRPCKGRALPTELSARAASSVRRRLP